MAADRFEMHLVLALAKRLCWFHDALQQSLAPNGIAPMTRAQSFVIGNIAAGESRAVNIARNLGVSRQAVSQVLLELEKRGDITLEDDPSDRRSRIVKFRAQFDKDGNTCASIFAAIEDELERRIGKRRMWNLRDALDAEWGAPPTVEVSLATKLALVG